MPSVSYQASVSVVEQVSKSYFVSVVVKAIDVSLAYSASVLVVDIPQCNFPGFVFLPTLSGLNVHTQGSESPSVTLLPHLISITVQAESC